MDTRDTAYNASLPSILDSDWLRAVVIVFLIETVMLFAVSAVPLPQGIRQMLVNQYNSLEGITSAPLLLSALYIFSHNYLVASIELVPLIGIISFVVSIADTALTVGALGVSTGVSGPLYILFLYTLPHTWLELPAYAVAITESMFLFMALYRGAFKGQRITEWGRLSAAWAVVAVELAVAALFEASELKLAELNPIYVYLSWLPFFVLAGIVLFLFVRASSRKGMMRMARQEAMLPEEEPAASPIAAQSATGRRTRRARPARKTARKAKRRKTRK